MHGGGVYCYFYCYFYSFYSPCPPTPTPASRAFLGCPSLRPRALGGDTGDQASERAVATPVPYFFWGGKSLFCGRGAGGSAPLPTPPPPRLLSPGVFQTVEPPVQPPPRSPCGAWGTRRRAPRTLGGIGGGPLSSPPQKKLPDIGFTAPAAKPRSRIPSPGNNRRLNSPSRSEGGWGVGLCPPQLRVVLGVLGEGRSRKSMKPREAGSAGGNFNIFCRGGVGF